MAVPSVFDGKNYTDWRQAVRDLTDHYGATGACFSSGEIAKTLRENFPDLRFSVPGVGEYVRDLFYSGGIIYPDQMTGLPNPAVQVSRMTQGLFPTRTPAGQPVFVYGPDQNAAENHEFEVYIPMPGQDPASYPDPVVPTTQAVFGLSGTDSATQVVSTPPPALPAPAGTAAPTGAVMIYGVPSKGLDLRATVHKERRVCVTRSAFEVLVHATQRPLHGGEPVYLRFELDANGEPLKAIVTRDSVPGAVPVDLRFDRGYIRFGSPGKKPFNPGDVYDVEVEGEGTDAALIVDLTKTVNN